MSTRKRRCAVLAVAIVVASAAVGGAIWAHAAGAGPAPEPAALAHKGAFRAYAVAQVAAQSAHSSIRGSQLEKRRGVKVTRTIGGGDELIAALTGSLTPVAVDSPDGGTVVYSSWRQISHPQPSDSQRGVTGQGVKVGDPVGIPSVRVYSDATGKDKLIATGAYSPALSLDGRLAFVRGDTEIVRQNVDYTGKIAVGSATGNSFETWTSESARYFPYAWAGKTLLAYKALPDSEAADLYALTGPDQARLLAPEAFVIALSLDASRLLVTVARRMVEVVRVSDGAIEASMPLDGGVVAADAPATPHALMFAGSWRGDRVVANSDAGLVVLNVANGIRIESLLATPTFPTGISEPIFVDDTHIVGWADLGAAPTKADKDEPAYANALVECDLAAKSCSVGATSPGRMWTRWVANPSQ
jgi:hypothetical protein